MHGNIGMAGVQPADREARHLEIQRALIYLSNKIQEFDDLVAEVRMGVITRCESSDKAEKGPPLLSLSDFLADCPNYLNGAAGRLSELTQSLRSALF